MKPHKVFGIGFHKTGTTTLGVILDRLGYRLAGFDEFRELARRESLEFGEVEERALEIAQNVDAAKDSPWPILYQSLDRAFPGAKFIHVTRDTDAWIDSVVKDFGEHPNALREVIYGCRYPKGNEAIWIDRYERHNAEVREYFADRPDDCLFFKLEDGLDVAHICSFLGEPEVKMEPPRANTRMRKNLKKLWWRFSKSR
jgi:hypothetical protein